MAKMFYNLDEASKRLSMSEAQIKELVRKGKLREFRDAGKVNYKADEVDAMVAAAEGSSGSGELVLEPAEESTIDLAMQSGSDVLTLAEADLDDTAAGKKTEAEKKDDTVVTSVGISVFDDEDLEGVADPLAQTVVSGQTGGGLGIEGVGSGSGLLDLTRESDDTSLGAELLDEIYPGDQEPGSGAGMEMGEATRAGLEEAIVEGPEGSDLFAPAGAGAAAAGAGALVVTRVEYPPDAISMALTGMMVVAVAVLSFAGVAVAAMLRGVSLPLLDFVYGKLWMFGAGAAVVAGLAMGLGFLLGKRGPAKE